MNRAEINLIFGRLCNLHRILVVRPNHRLGNQVLMTGLLTDLAHLLPGAEVDILTRGTTAVSLLAKFENVRSIFALPRHGVGHPLAIASTIVKMRNRQYDLLINTHPRSRNGRAYSAMARATYRLGHQEESAVADTYCHESVVPLSNFRQFLDLDLPSHVPLKVPLSEPGKASGRETLERLVRCDENAPRIVGIFAHASGDKLLDGQWWERFVGILSCHAPSYRLVEILPDHGRSGIGNKLPTFLTSDVERLAEVVGALDAFVSADCGVMHLASATGTPTIGLFAHDNIRQYRPMGQGNHAIDLRPLGSAADAAAACATRLTALHANLGLYDHQSSTSSNTPTG